MNNATLAHAVRKHIILTLSHCGGNRTQTAKILDISLRCLRDKLRGYANDGIEVTPAHQPVSELHSAKNTNGHATWLLMSDNA